MAELIKRYENPAPGEPAAEYLACGGVKVTVMAPPLSAQRQDGEEPPEWVKVSMRIIRARAEEYARETGQAPDLQLMEDFQRDMGAALRAWIADPRHRQFRHMSLKEYEDRMLAGAGLGF